MHILQNLAPEMQRAGWCKFILTHYSSMTLTTYFLPFPDLFFLIYFFGGRGTKNMKTLTWQNLCAPMFIVALLQCPLHGPNLDPHRQITKGTVGYILNGILLNYQKRWNSAFWDKMDGFLDGDDAKQNKRFKDRIDGFTHL